MLEFAYSICLHTAKRFLYIPQLYAHLKPYTSFVFSENSCNLSFHYSRYGLAAWITTDFKNYYYQLLFVFSSFLFCSWQKLNNKLSYLWRRNYLKLLYFAFASYKIQFFENSYLGFLVTDIDVWYLFAIVLMRRFK